MQDKKLVVRFDCGEKFKDDGNRPHNLVLQSYKDAENTAINKVTKKSIYAKMALIQVPMSEDGKELHSDIAIEDKPIVVEGV